MKLFRRHTTSHRFNRCGELGVAWSGLRAWYQTPLGDGLAATEKGLVDATLADLFGYYLLQIGAVCGTDWLQSSRVSQCTLMDFLSPEHDQSGHMQGMPQALPIQTDSLDVVVMPHVLEFSLHPHAILREVERVLIPEGHLVMLVFNPRSLWSLWRWSVGWRRRAPWCGRFISTTRIKDWMELLGFDVVKLQGYFFRPPLQKTGIMDKLAFYERLGARFWPILGASHLIVARKRVTTLTPIRPSWRPRAKIVSPGLVEPFQNKEKHGK